MNMRSLYMELTLAMNKKTRKVLFCSPDVVKRTDLPYYQGNRVFFCCLPRTLIRLTTP